jgi:VIT1/CCC1 family predicted Fe2+/Mn2+ transporter
MYTTLRSTIARLLRSGAQKDHGHSPPEIEERLSLATQTNLLRDFVYGAIDGTISTFAIISGIAGAGLSQQIIVVLGLASILADGFSMAAGNYLSTRSELQNLRRLTSTEKRHIELYPQGERAELEGILSQHGLQGETLQTATDIICQHKPLWINLMLAGEYGLSPVEPRPVAAALATFGAFVACGSLPLIPFVFLDDSAYLWSVIATALTFFVIGALKSRWSIEPWIVSATQTVLIGGAAAGIAYSVGALISTL